MQKRIRKSKARVKWDRDPQEVVHQDIRTKRERTRSAMLSAAIEDQLAELDEELEGLRYEAE
jgi:hypothetical protein